MDEQPAEGDPVTVSAVASAITDGHRNGQEPLLPEPIEREMVAASELEPRVPIFSLKDGVGRWRSTC